jgi:glycosyltransferase involved in cell wall biosynthesis
MLFFLKVLFILSTFTLFSTETKKKIVLNMIVKNEEKVIERCLSSVYDFIDYWVIVDTGSSDKTIEVIRRFMKDKPGEIFERPWVDFSHNRQEALELAKPKGDYILFMDADDTLTFEPGFQLPKLTLDFYGIYNKTSKQQWLIPRLVNAKLPWKWLGVLHEYICCDFSTSGDVLDKVWYDYLGGGARSQDPDRINKDISVLKSGLVKEPLNRRYLYYLATTSETGKRYEEAIEWYKKRASYADEGDPDEVFLSLYAIGKLYQAIGVNQQLVLDSFVKAYKFLPTRIEPLFYILTILIKQNRLDEGFDLASKALMLPKRGNYQLTDHWIEDYGLLTAYAEICLKKGLIIEASFAIKQLLSDPNIPDTLKKQVLLMQEEIQKLELKTVHQAIFENLKKIQEFG